MKPLSFHGLWLILIMFPILLSLSSAIGLIDHPTPGPATKDPPLVLAANRTTRPDILQGFQRYQGGWDLGNQHYWASVGFIGGVGFILAVLSFISFGLAVAIHLCCGWRINIKDHGSRTCLMLLILFSFVAVLKEGQRLSAVLKDHFFQADPLSVIHQHLQNTQPIVVKQPKKKVNKNGSKKRKKSKASTGLQSMDM